MLAITVKPLQADFGELGAMLAAAAALLVFIYVLARQQGASIPHDDKQTVQRHSRQRVSGMVAGLAGIVVLIAVPRLVAAIEASEPSRLDAEVFRPVLDCVESGARHAPWQPRFDDPAVEWSLAFNCNGQVINVYVAAYASALQGAELVTSSHYVVPSTWDRFIESREKVALSGHDVAEIVVSRPNYESIVWYWYAVGEEATTSTVKAKILQVLALLGRNPAGGAVYVLDAPVSGDPGRARQQLQQVTDALMSRKPFEPGGTAQ
jgi:EpsI family protein